MRKISLYRFLTTFYVFPVTDWGAFLQRIFYGFIIVRLFDLLKAPLFWISLVALLTYSPETVAWIFIKIGEIEITVFSMLMSIVMPDIFGAVGTEYSSWSQIWQAGLNALPTTVVEVMNSLGVAQMLGLVTTTIGAIMTIRILRSIYKRIL